jgi:DNA primase
MNSVAEFLQDIGFNVTRSYGNEVVAYCPWHEDSTASLAINPENGWHCWLWKG